MHETIHDTRRGFWDNLTTGLKVVGAELRRIALGRVRAFEIRQIRRRLEREYETLGRLAEPLLSGPQKSAPGSPKPAPDAQRAVDLSLKQLEFLRREIAQLEAQRPEASRPAADTDD